MTPLRVGVAGALGRMGRVACAAVESAEDMQLVARFARGDELQAFFAHKLDVVVDFTVYPISRQVADEAIRAGARVVVGATGWPEADVISFRDAVENAKLGALIVPNFAIGAVLLMRLAEIAAPHFRGVEIIEMHHDQKKDKPSGTARLTAERLESVVPGLGKIPIHSIRLPGLVAHQSVLFGAPGQTLEIRHDSLARESFAEGILLAIRDVMKRRGLTIGLDSVLFSEASP
ncbi:MAG: dihydrodipicolinate reductase C-terminal domain-containing protein [Vulcanimicrobiaceae bacterium]|jgi:4-hydroxy-tetrahydrodipicolinate reductase